jgi:hypothetical protein
MKTSNNVIVSRLPLIRNLLIRISTMTSTLLQKSHKRPFPLSFPYQFRLHLEVRLKTAEYYQAKSD